jgi:hypothetical protein
LEHIDSSNEASVHLTIGIDTLIWGLNYANLRSLSLKLAGIEDKLLPTKLPSEIFWRLQRSLPLGFLSTTIIEQHKGYEEAMRSAIEEEIVSELLQCIRLAEPVKYSNGSVSDNLLQEQLHCKEVVQHTLNHYVKTVDIFGRMYYDIANQLSPAKFNLNFFRSQVSFIHIFILNKTYI